MFGKLVLLIVNDPVELSRVTHILCKNNVKHTVRTKRNQTRLGMMLHTQMITRVYNGNTSFNECVDPMAYTYTVKVNKKDFEKAKALISIN